ncbi:MAG: HAD family hydrolase [Nanoarchaeota archaeon]|nr:HAD family hydrolase [Nanoarchaeota archaeon]MBU4300360.1 HAD family hydrolase [Nanoarchaeota archaeon]MBU4452149.1 HAD family hydrolase [Nanoarchaeota archaeon]MCG2724282.1 HAD family hydrolase [archaeon]
MKILITDLENVLTNDAGLESDAMDFLSGAHEKFFIVLLTNLPAKNTQERVKSLGITGVIDFVISAADYEMAKPDSRMINVLLAILNAETKKFGKNDMILIGDKPDRDIKLANNAGVQSIRVRRGKHAAQEPEYADEIAKVEVKSLADLIPILGITIKKEEPMGEKKARKKPQHKKSVK